MTFDDLKNKLQDNLFDIITSYLMFDLEFLTDLNDSKIWRGRSVFDMSKDQFEVELRSTIGNCARTYILEFITIKHLIKNLKRVNIEYASNELVFYLVIIVKLLKVFMEKLIDSCWDYIDKYWWGESFSELLKDYWGIKGLC